ncbi:MAG: hypothetical protein JWM59_998 [Verrucomicrobiales bacterium]|nr:hypothetical protein [Verrucomicrobiales bacterium]
MECHQYQPLHSRRDFLSRTGLGLGAVALSQLLGTAPVQAAGGLPGLPHFKPKAKRVIYLFQAGGPPHLDLFDPKPVLDKRFDEDLPDSVRGNQRITGMVTAQARLALQPSKFKFEQSGQSGQWISEVLPYTRKIADELCVIRSMNTEAINHDPAITMLQTGSQQPGRPSIGAWLDYGLGSLNENLPSYMVMCSVPSKGTPDQGLLSRLWGSGFLPSRHQGVQLRGGTDPVLYLTDAPGISRDRRRMMLDGLAEMNGLALQSSGDPEIEARISQYEMAFRMQASVPDLTDLSKEPQSTWDLYGEEAKKPGTFARHCLLARRMAERGVGFIQLYHRGWDVHGGLAERVPILCGDVDRASAALVTDLKQRGLLDETLVIFGGEFGRTCYAQGGANRASYGRDHHGRCFSLWMAGGGVKPGISHGSTDDFGFNIATDAVHVHDLHATILHTLGIDHERLTFRFQGRQFRLTDVAGKVVRPILA